MKRQTTPSNFFLLVLVLVLALQSCATADRLIESGDYDTAIEMSKSRLVGKKKKSPEMVMALEEAFRRANERDLATIERLKADNQNANWSRIHDVYVRIDKRQQSINPLLPLIDKNGYEAGFRFVEVTQLERESRENAAAYHYDRARNLLDQARVNGDKMAARSAYRETENVRTYFRDYRDITELQRMAHQLGTVNVLVAVENSANIIAPQDFERRLRQINAADLNSFWQQYHLTAQAAQTYDYRMVLRINNIQVSPEMMYEREYTDIAEIEDGFEYVLDNNGNVRKDSLGNDIKVPRKVIIKAWVFETRQFKQADVQATLEVINLRTNQLVRSQNITASTQFEHYASTFRGDDRALSTDSRRCIGNRPMPFPSDELLILQAADRLKPSLQERLVDYRELI